MRTLTTGKTKTNAPVLPVTVYIDPTLESLNLRIAKLETASTLHTNQIAALQLVIREHAGYTDAIDVDVEELLDDAFGGAEG